MKTLALAVLALLSLSFAPLGAEAAKAPRTIELSGPNTVILYGSIDILSVDTLVAALIGKRMALEPEETLYLLIVSGGGEYNAAMSLLRVMNTIPNMQVICKYCASAAGMIFSTYTNHNRLVTDKSELLMHEMYMDHVTADMINNRPLIESLKRDSEKFNCQMRSVMGMSKEAYEAKIVGKEWVVRGKDLVKLKLANELVKLKCDGYISRLAPQTCN